MTANGPVPEYVDEVVKTLSQREMDAIMELDEFYGRGPAHISSILGIDIKEARGVLKRLRKEGVVVLTTLWDEDQGLVCGKGYWLDLFGRAVRDRIKECFA